MPNTPKSVITWSSIQSSPSGSDLQCNYWSCLETIGSRFNLTPGTVACLVYEHLNPAEATTRPRNSHNLEFDEWEDLTRYLMTTVDRHLRKEKKDLGHISIDQPVNSGYSKLPLIDQLEAPPSLGDEEMAYNRLLEVLEEQAANSNRAYSKIARRIIKSLKDQEEITQTSVAHELNIHQSTVSRCYKELREVCRERFER